MQEFITAQGLPAQTAQATNLYSQRLTLTSSSSATVALVGIRNSLALSAFYQRSQDAPNAGLLATGRDINNNTQTGVSLALSHRLSNLTSLSTSLGYTRIQAEEAISGSRTKEADIRVLVTTQVAVRTAMSFGGHFRKIGSNVATSGHEAAAFVGVDHAF